MFMNMSRPPFLDESRSTWQHSLQNKQSPLVCVSRHQMHMLRAALKGPDPQPLMARLGLRPLSKPYFRSSKFRFFLGDIGRDVTCMQYASRFKNTQRGNHCLAILKSFDDLSRCKWNEKTHMVFFC
jgi:hypothetical protein